MFFANRISLLIIPIVILSIFFTKVVHSQSFDNSRRKGASVETYINVDGIEYWFTESIEYDESLIDIENISEVCGAVPGMIVSTEPSGSDSLEFRFNSEGTGIDSVHFVYHNMCGFSRLEISSFFQTGPGKLIDSQSCIAEWIMSCISNITGGHELTFDLNNRTVTDRLSSAGNCSIICAEKQFSYSITDVNVLNPEIPSEYVLEQNYPNPFNPTTIINYQIPESGFVKIIIIDALGRELNTLVNEHKNAGTFSVKFNAENLSSGNYFYMMDINGFTQTRKFTILK